MASLGTLVVNLGANNAALNRGLNQADASVSSFVSRTNAALAGVGSMAAAAATAGIAGVLTAGAAAIGAGGWALKLAADAETAAIQMEVLTGSGKLATEMIKELRRQALESPFGTAELTDAANTLLLFGVETEKVTGLVEVLSEISAGSADKLNRLSLAMAQSAAAGRLMGQDLLQMVNGGFNPLQQISKRTGETLVQLKARMEDGAIAFAEVEQAFRDATAEGGRFFGMNEKMLGTAAGQWGLLKEQITSIARDIGTLMLPIAKDVLTTLSQWTEPVTQAVEGFGQLANKAEWMTDVLKASWDFSTAYIARKWDDMLIGMLKSTVSFAANLAKLAAGGAAGGLIAGGKIGNGENEQQALARLQGLLAQLQQAPPAADNKPEWKPGGFAQGLLDKMHAEQIKGMQDLGKQVLPGLMQFGSTILGMHQAAGSMIAGSFGGKGTSGNATPLPQSDARLSGAMEKGSAEAFSTIIANVLGGRQKSEAVKATEKQTQVLGKKLDTIATKTEATKLPVIDNLYGPGT